MRDAFKKFGVHLGQVELDLMMKRFDSNNDGYLTYTDICGIFKPRNQKLSKEFDQRMPLDYQISNLLS